MNVYKENKLVLIHYYFPVFCEKHKMMDIILDKEVVSEEEFNKIQV